MYNNIKQYVSTTDEHRKKIIQLLGKRNFINAQYSTILENTYGCADQYRFEIALHLLSILSPLFNIIIDRGISDPGHGNEVVDGLNDT